MALRKASINMNCSPLDSAPSTVLKTGQGRPLIRQPTDYSGQVASRSAVQHSMFDVRCWMLARASSSGVALVMVLGVLTVMVMLAVAFAISMRTERLAAGNALDTVRARQLAQVGLARAMDDLSRMMGTNLASANPVSYPPWSVTNMFATNAVSTNRSFMVGEAMNFAPGALSNIANDVDGRINPSNRWIQIQTVTTNIAAVPPVINTNIFGRVAYMIINCSGLLDANFAGGGTRGVGTNPNEIVLTDLPDGAIVANRATHIRYETLPELAALTAVYPINFGVYSYAPAGYWDPLAKTNKFPVNLRGAAADLINRKAEIITAFTNASFSPADAGILYLNLIDYVDEKSIPGDLNGTVPANFAIPSMEPVPMFNEIRFLWDAPATAGDPSTVTVTYELWFPYLNKSATVKINGSINFGGTSISTIQTTPEITFNSPGYSVSVPFTASVAGGSVAPQIVIAEITMDGVPVDALQPNTILPISVSQNGAMNRLECLDPRNNYDPSDPKCWRVASSMVNNQNDFTTAWWTTNQNWDTDGVMYATNGTLKSVGELGYLVYAPWRTIKLYGPNLDRVLDVFAIGANATDVYVTNAFRGLVNFTPSGATQALAAVFNGMPVDSYPSIGGTPLSSDEAISVATNIMAHGPYTNLADLGYAFTTNYMPHAGDELEREAFIRNTCGLLTTRQQIFTIIIEAQTAAGGIFARNPPRQRAVALVWRDAFTGEMFVRWLKWLKD